MFSNVISVLKTSFLPTVNSNDCLSNSKILKLGNVIQNVANHIDIKLSIPTIVCVGSQSSGKSSVINAMLGMDILPTGKNMVTRTPLRIELIQTACPDRSDILQKRIEFGEYIKCKWVPYKICSLHENEKIGSNEICNTIEKKTNEYAGTSSNICNKEILIKYFSPNVPNLTIVDLPGLVQVACSDMGHPDDICDQIEELIASYAIQKETIVLAIIKARSDLEADPSLALVKKYDKLGERTIGVLTKVDLMEQDTHIGNYITGKVSSSLKFKYGYWAVKNRSSPEKKLYNAIQGLEIESTFFNSHPIYSSLQKSHPQFGIKQLSGSLSKILISKLQCILPGLLTQLQQLYDCSKLELLSIESPVPSTSQGQSAIINHALNTFVNDFKSGISFKIGKKLKHLFIKFRTDCCAIKPFTNIKYSDQYLKNILENCEGNHMSYSIPPIEVLEQCLLEKSKDKNPYNEIFPYALICLNQIKTSLCDHVETLVSKERFESLQTFLKQQVTLCIESQMSIVISKIKESIDTEQCYVWLDDNTFQRDLNICQDNKQKQTKIGVIRSLLQSYFQHSSRQISHNIPKIIMKNLICFLDTQLAQILFSNLANLTCPLFLTENEQTRLRRKELQTKIDQLENILKMY